MKKDFKICSCGKIHLISEEYLEETYESNTSYIFICADCGDMWEIGGNKILVSSPSSKTPKYIYNVYLYNIRESLKGNVPFIISKESFENRNNRKPISKIVYNMGIRVPMKNGFYATHYSHGQFADTRYDFHIGDIERSDVTAEEVLEHIRKNREDSTTVNMERFIRETDESDLKEISKYLIDAFDWTGTKYKTEFN